MVAELLPALAATAASLAASSSNPSSSSSPPPVSPASIWPLSPERQAAVCGLVPAIDRARLYRGKGGEVMREAVSRLVECGAEVGLPLALQQHAKVLEVRAPVGVGAKALGEGEAGAGLKCSAPSTGTDAAQEGLQSWLGYGVSGDIWVTRAPVSQLCSLVCGLRLHVMPWPCSTKHAAHAFTCSGRDLCREWLASPHRQCPHPHPHTTNRPQTLDENLRHPHAYIQAGAVAAVKAYCRAYLTGVPLPLAAAAAVGVAAAAAAGGGPGEGGHAPADPRAVAVAAASFRSK